MVKSMVLRELHTLEETTMDKVRFLMSDTGAPFTAACREALEQKGVDVTVVEKDGNKVLQKMLAVRPQVVLLDAFMPGLDALAVKQRYNAAGERHTSFFVTGAFQSEEMYRSCWTKALPTISSSPLMKVSLPLGCSRQPADRKSTCSTPVWTATS